VKSKFKIGEIVKDPDKEKCVVVDRLGHGRYRVRYYYDINFDLLDPYDVDIFQTTELKSTNRFRADTKVVYDKNMW
jgi:hypothetical protein